MRSTKAIVLSALALLAGGASAQQYPNKPIRVVVQCAACGPEITTRAVTTEMAKRLGQPFVIEARPGAAGAQAANAVKEAAPDGYTLYGGAFQNLHPTIEKNNPTIGGKDLAPVADYAEYPLYIFVRSSLGPKTLQELVAYSKANPGKLNWGSQVTNLDMLLEVIKNRTGLSATNVRFKGPPTTELLNSTVDFTFASISTFAEHVKAGKVIPLLASSRSPLTPNVPLGRDLGLPMPDSRQGLWAPPRATTDIRNKLAAEIALAIKTPAVTELWTKLAYAAVANPTPEDQLRVYDEAIAAYAEGARLSGLKPE